MSQDAGGGAPAWGSSPSSGWGTPPSGPAATPPGPGGPHGAGSAPQGFGTAPQGFASAPRPLDVVPSGSPSSGAPVSAPVVWLALAAVLEIVGLALGLAAADRPTLSVAGWLIGGFGAIGALAWFTLADSRRRTDPWYSATRMPGVVRGVLAATAVAVVAMNALQFADWASRR